TRGLEKELFGSLDQPSLVAPISVRHSPQLSSKYVVIELIGRNHFWQRAKTTGFLPPQSAVQTLQVLTQFDATLLGRNQQRYQFSCRARSRMRPVIEAICRQGFEQPHEGWVFSIPSLNEELSIAEFSAWRLCCHGYPPERRIFLSLGATALFLPPSW